jgi:predicted anti-sigma-YlaC factor YlaD
VNSDQIKATLLFPVKDAYSRRQFLTACLIMLAGTIVPVIPIFLLLGYGARIARQIVLEKKEPGMTGWDDWDEFFHDGARLFGIRIILALPLILLMFVGTGLFTMTSIVVSASDSSQSAQNLPSIAMAGFVAAMIVVMLVGLLAIPITFLTFAAETHVAVKGSLSAGLQFREWWPILKNGAGAFLAAFLVIAAVSFAFSFIISFATITIVLICILPLVIFPYAAYLVLVNQALAAQAYAISQASLQAPAK